MNALCIGMKPAERMQLVGGHRPLGGAKTQNLQLFNPLKLCLLNFQCCFIKCFLKKEKGNWLKIFNHTSFSDWKNTCHGPLCFRCKCRNSVARIVYSPNMVSEKKVSVSFPRHLVLDNFFFLWIAEAILMCCFFCILITQIMGNSEVATLHQINALFIYSYSF